MLTAANRPLLIGFAVLTLTAAFVSDAVGLACLGLTAVAGLLGHP